MHKTRNAIFQAICLSFFKQLLIKMTVFLYKNMHNIHYMRILCILSFLRYPTSLVTITVISSLILPPVTPSTLSSNCSAIS